MEVEKVIAAGRSMAQNWIEASVKSAANPTQMNNQLFVLRVACIHVLATEAYNEVEQGGVDPVIALTALKQQLESEYDTIVAHGESVLIEPKRHLESVPANDPETR